MPKKTKKPQAVKAWAKIDQKTNKFLKDPCTDEMVFQTKKEALQFCNNANEKVIRVLIKPL